MCDLRQSHIHTKVEAAVANEMCRRGAHLPSLGSDAFTTEVCDAWLVPTVTFPAAWHHRLLTGTKYSCQLWTTAREQRRRCVSANELMTTMMICVSRGFG